MNPMYLILRTFQAPNHRLALNLVLRSAPEPHADAAD